MSGIFAYTGNGLCRDIIINGLCRLESRGSALCGIAERGDNGIAAYKFSCPPRELLKKADVIKNEGYTGIGECKNAFRKSPSGTGFIPGACEAFAVAVDGDVKNFNELKRRLPSGNFIRDDEDLLLAMLMSSQESGLKGLREIWEKTEGLPGIVTISEKDNSILCIAGENPLYIGIYENGAAITNGLGALTDGAIRYFILECGQLARVTAQRASAFDIKLKRIKKQMLPLPDAVLSEDEFTPAESIFCLPSAVKDTFNSLCDGSKITLGGCKITHRFIEKTEKIIITGSDGCYNAALFALEIAERLTDIPCRAFPSGELKHSSAFFDRETLLIAISDSGEDINACACVKRAKDFGAKTLGITKADYSYLAECCDKVIYTSRDLAGNNMKFCSFASNSLALCLLMLKIGFITEIINSVYYNVAINIAQMLSGKISAAIKPSAQMTAFARSLITGGRVIITGLCSDALLSSEAASSLRIITGINAFSASLTELKYESTEYIKASRIVALITDRELAFNSLKELGLMRSGGADITIIAAESIAEEAQDFENVITFPDSIPLFNGIVAISCIYNAANTALGLIENDEQKAI